MLPTSYVNHNRGPELLRTDHRVWNTRVPGFLPGHQWAHGQWWSSPVQNSRNDAPQNHEQIQLPEVKLAALEHGTATKVLSHSWHKPIGRNKKWDLHYDDVIMTMLASQITSLTVVYSIVYSGVNQRKHQSSASLAFVWEIHRGPVNFPHKWPVTRKMFPFDDVIMGGIVVMIRSIGGIE